MNYRHSFHAGNAGDCLKHALLLVLLRAMQRKLAPMFVLDTHAGEGAYDLSGPEASRAGEWRAGIGRLLDDPPAALRDYVTLVKRFGLYPGSPMLLRALLRADDRMACCELHPGTYDALRRRFRGDPQTAIHRRDGWEALGALLPPVARRGLVLIDPPYEAADELVRLVAGLRRGYARFPTGVFAAWYPIKHRAPVRDFLGAIVGSGIRDVVAAELCWRAPVVPARLNGSGLLVVNPPYGFTEEAEYVMAALQDRLGDSGCREGAAVTRVVGE